MSEKFVWSPPQISQYIKSNFATIFIELEGKNKRFCFTKGQISKICLELKITYRKHSDKLWMGSVDGCRRR